MDALLELEKDYPNAGRSLLPIFFPGPLFPDENAKWDALRKEGDASATVIDRGQHVDEITRQPDSLESWALQAKSFET